jgi:hypothetical protein
MCKSLVVQIVQKKFAEEKSLSLHLRVYNGVKYFSCSQCVRSFAQLKHLKTHVNIHDEEMFNVFTVLSDLKKHFKVHSVRNSIIALIARSCLTKLVL